MKLTDFCKRHYLALEEEIIVKEYNPSEDRLETVAVINRDSTVNVFCNLPDWDLELLAIVHGEYSEDDPSEGWDKYILIVTNRTYRVDEEE